MMTMMMMMWLHGNDNNKKMENFCKPKNIRELQPGY